MNEVVVDTDVVSFMFKSDSRADPYRRHLENSKRRFISFMTVAELDRWALKYHWGDIRRLRMEEYLQYFIVYPSDRDLCLQWAYVQDQAARKGRPISCADAWIAATALLLKIPLITHNRSDYEGVPGLIVISEGAKIDPF